MSRPQDIELLDVMRATEEYIRLGLGGTVQEALWAVTGDAAVRNRALGFYLAVEPQPWPDGWKRMADAIKLAQRDVDMLDFFRDEGVAA